MRILVATGLYPPDIGGPATYAKMLETELPKADMTPTVLPFGTVRHLPKGLRHLAYLQRLFREGRQADVIYALDPISVGVPTWLVACILRKPFMVRLGGDYAWEQGRMRFGLTSTLDEYTAGAERRPLPVKFFRTLQTFVVTRARHVVLPSEYLKSIVMTWGVSEERITVVYSALFPLPVQAPRETIRQQLSYEGVVLLTAARLTPWKGIDCVIRLVAALKKSGLEATLIIAGNGEAKEALEAEAVEHDVRDQVRFVGKLSKEALGAAIKGADVFVYNTSYEGLPHQLLEVMDIGTPIVTTDIPGNREVIRDGIEGLLIPHNDLPAMEAAVRRVLDNEPLRNRLIASARARTKDFEQSKVTSALVALLQRIT